MKRLLFILVAAVVGYTATFAKQPQEPTSYNYQRGKELINNEDYDEGISVLQKELADNPKNGYAYMVLSNAYASRTEIGNALSAADNALKYLPKKASSERAQACYVKAWAYGCIDDTVQALAYYTEAIRYQPKDADWYFVRGWFYNYLKNYDLALADIQQVIALEPNSAKGYSLFGQTYLLMKRYADALTAFEKADKLDSNYETLAERADVEIRLGRYEDAAKHIIASLADNSLNQKAVNLLQNINPSLRRLLLTELNIKQRAEPNTPDWIFYEVYIYDDAKDYEKMLQKIPRLNDLIPVQYAKFYEAKAYFSIGDFEKALDCINAEIAADSTDTGSWQQRAEVYARMDSTEQMFRDLNTIIEKDPTNAGYYNDRGQAYLFSGQYQKAIEDYDMAIALDSQPYLNYMRGRCYWEIGDTLSARMDFEKATKGNNNSSVCFALHFMGQDSLATHKMDSILVADSLAHEELYDAACLYALQGRTEDAFRLLTQELENNNAQYAYARRDIDFRNIHGARFDSLLSVYEARVQERILRLDSTTQDAVQTERVVEVPFSAANGVTTVKCSINGLPLTFVFDTGASDVSISQTEASFMYKNGYLSKKDIVGNSAYITADGSISIGTNIILQKIDFGGLELKAVRASVVGNQRAPLLLGQSVLQRLGKIEIDNQRQVLKITTKK